MIIIMSSAYVSDEFQAEIGAIPPTLLPLGNRKLLEHQVEAIRKVYGDEEIILSLPQSFELSETLKKQVGMLNIKISLIPDKFTLSEAVLYLLNTTDLAFNLINNVTILYGDTYISDLYFSKNSADLIAIAEAKTSYAWEYVSESLGESLVWCGFFRFGDIPSLLKSLALNRESFNEAVKSYADKVVMTYSKTDHWYDLGHINTYFLARAQLTTQRSFNELIIKDGIVRKSGLPQIKIEAEANWFLTVPPAIRKFIPLLIDHGVKEERYHYDLEYLPCMPLNELFVHGHNRVHDWSVIFKEIKKFFQATQSIPSVEDLETDFQSLVKDKTNQRLEIYLSDKNIGWDQSLYYEGDELPSVLQICEQCFNAIDTLPKAPGILHGDLCFSNMLFDSRGVRLKVLDPRGLSVNKELTIYGDRKYDLAKLTHSVIGLYDFIISGNYRIKNRGTKQVSLIFDIEPRISLIQEEFSAVEFIAGISTQKIIPLVVLLFLSMIPLHEDRPDRQEAMWLNALRLHRNWLRG